MLDLKTQTQLMDATVAMMRSLLLATANTWAASARRGLSMWVECTAPAGRPSPLVADSVAREIVEYASYRSAGGHAAAQVIVKAPS
jgi:hypothetical protein